MDMNDIGRLVEDQGKSWTEFQAVQGARMKNLESEVLQLAKKAGRPPVPDDTRSDSGKHLEQFIDTKTGKAVPVFTHADKLQQKADGIPSMGRLLRGIILGGQAHDAQELADERKSLNMFSDSSGGYTVAGELSSQWIDLLRANMVLSKAGAVTLPMDTGQVTIARVTADPVITWKGESAAISEAEPTFGNVTLTAKTCVCLVKLSLELSQDSQNIEQILQTTITQSMAAAIDSAGLNGTTTDQAAAPGGIFNLSGINTISTVGAPTTWDFLADAIYELLLDNVPMSAIGAVVGHPAIWKKMVKLRDNANNPLQLAPECAALPKLWTTAAPFTSGTTCSAIIGDWRDLIFGVRKDIQVRVLSEAFMGSNLQVAVLAYARVDFAPTRATSFCVMPGITI